MTMRILHLPAIFEGGLRRAVLDYAAASPEQYQSLIWRCGSGGIAVEGQTIFAPTIAPLNLSLRMLQSAWQGNPAADIVHHHGCWSLTSLTALVLKKRHGLRFVYSPHGAFVPASLERYGKFKSIYLNAWERRVLPAVDCFHATSPEEAEAIRMMVGNRPIAIIPNGIDLQQAALAERHGDFWRPWGIPDGAFRILFLSRLVDDKGVDLLLQAMAQVLQQVPRAHCLIVGDGPDNYVSKLHGLAQHLGIAASVTFLGPVWGDEKFALMRHADLFVLPSRNEAQAIVVMEALSQNLPVLASRNTPWSGLVGAGCGWWEDNSPDVLAEAIVRIAGMDPAELLKRGEVGREFLRQNYSLAAVHSDLKDLYLWIAGGMDAGEQPVTISRQMPDQESR